MKKGLLFFILCVSTMLTRAQGDTTKAQTRIEAFSNSKSRLIHKVYYAVGPSKAVDVKVLTIRDLVSESVQKGVVLSWFVSIGTYSTADYQAFLDADELEDLIKAVTKLITIIKANVQESYTEYIFRTRGGFSIAIFSEVGKPWTVSVENRFTKSYKSFKPEDLEKLNQSLIMCRERVK